MLFTREQLRFERIQSNGWDLQLKETLESVRGSSIEGIFSN
jgi:hypothetical protein